MFFSKYIAVSFLLFCLSLDAANYVRTLFHFCFSQTKYTANSPYATNLNGLLNQLSTKVPPTGFGLGFIGDDENRVNGLALCRGDVSITNCKTCVIDAGKELRHRCPYKKGAIIWYDYCLLKYSDMNFLGKIDNGNKFHLSNKKKVKNPTSFNRRVKDWLSRLSKAASTSPGLYAAGFVLMPGSSEILYGLVQCTRDLSHLDCKLCLDGVIGGFPKCCDGKRGGRVVGGSCNFRYELYPFFEMKWDNF